MEEHTVMEEGYRASVLAGEYDRLLDTVDVYGCKIYRIEEGMKYF